MRAIDGILSLWVGAFVAAVEAAPERELIGFYAEHPTEMDRMIKAIWKYLSPDTRQRVRRARRKVLYGGGT